MLSVGLDASAAAVRDPTGVAAAIRSLALSLREVASSEGLALETLYRISRLKRRATFLPGSRVFHDRLSFLLARRLGVFHGPDARLPRLRGPRLVATVHDLSVRKDERFAAPGFRETRERHWADCARRADLIVTYTEAVRREVSRELGFPLERIVAVPLAAQADASPPPASDRVRELSRLGLDPSGGHVLVLGELSLRKNTTGAIEAFARASELSEAVRRTKLVIVGRDGHGAESVRATLASSGLGERARALGWLEPRASAAVLASASVLLFPSRSEGFGLPVLEAFRASVPVLASREPSLVEVSGGAALHEDPEDREALARALVQLVEDEAQRSELVARGLARQAEFSWERSARELARVYRAAATGARVVEAESSPCPAEQPSRDKRAALGGEGRCPTTDPLPGRRCPTEGPEGGSVPRRAERFPWPR